jgi:hypothetical protein
MSASRQFTNTDMGHSLGYLFHILHTHHTHSQQPTLSDQWDISMGTPTFVDSDSNNNNDDDNNKDNNSDNDNDDNNNKDNNSDKENWPEPPAW